MDNDKINTIKKVAEDVVKQENMFLVDVELKHQKIPEYWILVDTEQGGVNLDACSRISREIGSILEDEEMFTGSYRLNVSSPGLSRPLSDKRQYGKNRGRTAKIKFKENENYHSVQGVIDRVDDQSITILDDDNTQKEISFDSIVETKIIPKI
jgi:ribosome maturation factor RimP